MNLALELLSVGAPDVMAIQSGPNAVTYRELRGKVDSREASAWRRDDELLRLLKIARRNSA